MQIQRQNIATSEIFSDHQQNPLQRERVIT